MSLVSFACAYCGGEGRQQAGAVNRARAKGAALYCGRKCSGLGRRKPPKSAAQKKAEKAAYDVEYREKNRALLQAKKAAYYREHIDRDKEREARKRRMPKHVEYCRRPEYRVKKKAYDRPHRAKKFYGPLWEAALLTQDIRNAVLEQQTDYEVRLAKGTLSKSQKRKRSYDQSQRTRTLGQNAQVGALGNLAARKDRQDGARSGR
jgi:hypothetical protein